MIMSNKKYVCPECGSSLKHERRDDGYERHEITPDGDVTVISSDSDGYNSVYCSYDSDHDIPVDLINEVIVLVCEAF